MMPIDAAGFITGNFFAPISIADAQLRLVTEGGDGITSAVLGHVTALVYLRGDPTARCPDVPVTAGGCVPPTDYPTYSEDFTAYADYVAFTTARYYSEDAAYMDLFSTLYIENDDPATETLWSGFDTSVTFADQPHSLRGVIQDVSGTLHDGVGWITYFEPNAETIVAQWVVDIEVPSTTFPSTYSGSPLGAGDQGYGWNVFQWEDKNLSYRYFHELTVRSGRLYYEVSAGGGSYVDTAVDLGDWNDFVGATKQITIKASYDDATTARLSVYLDAPCPDAPATPTLWATVTGARMTEVTSPPSTSKWRTGTINYAPQYRCDLPVAPLRAATFTHQWSYNQDPTLYGL